MAGQRFIARSRVMRALSEQVRRFARSDSNVLVAGETGAGKNAIARELHVRGPRARRPFVTIDCASLSASLIDSELFGHERGAFTDAVAARPGRFELAGSGTVYLDAVTELPVEAQGKLLRIVEEKRVERLGGHTSFAITARLVASSSADIEDAVRRAAFRHDLFHRLRVLPLLVPPLRERRDDILPLAAYFISQTVRLDGRRVVPAIASDAAAALQDYRWPGNVRELRHVVERACQTGRREISLTDLPGEVLESSPEEAVMPPPITLEQLERRHIAAILRYARGNQTEAARLLGISRKALWEKRKRYGLD